MYPFVSAVADWVVVSTTYLAAEAEKREKKEEKKREERREGREEKRKTMSSVVPSLHPSPFLSLSPSHLTYQNKSREGMGYSMNAPRTYTMILKEEEEDKRMLFRKIEVETDSAEVKEKEERRWKKRWHTLDTICVCISVCTSVRRH